MQIFNLIQRATAVALMGAVLMSTSQVIGAPNSNPIMFVVPQNPGGSNDIFARALAPHVAKELGQSVVVDNKTGAGGNIGTSQVARAINDGSTWLVTAGSVLTMNPWLFKNVGFDAMRDFEPTSGIVKVPHVLLVNKALPVGNVKELVELLKKEPDKYFFGTAGNGTYSHLLIELLKKSAKVNITHVPFKGVSPALTELMAGRIQVLISTVPAALPYIQNGDVKAIAVMSDERSELLPDLPLAKDTVPGLVGDLWIGIYAPKGTSAAQVNRMHNAVAAALATSALLETFRKQGATALNLTPVQLKALTKQDSEVWSKLIEQNNIRME